MVDNFYVIACVAANMPLKSHPGTAAFLIPDEQIINNVIYTDCIIMKYTIGGDIYRFI